MEGVDGLDCWLLDLLEGLEHGIQEKLDMFFSEWDGGCLEPVDVGLYVAIIAVFRDKIGFSLFIIGFKNFGEGLLVFVEVYDGGVYISSLVLFHSDEPMLRADS